METESDQILKGAQSKLKRSNTIKHIKLNPIETESGQIKLTGSSAVKATQFNQNDPLKPNRSD